MVRETVVQSQVKLYQRLLKWYLIAPCLTLSNIMYVSRIKWSNPGKGVVSPPPQHLGVIDMEKGAFWSPSTMVANFTYLIQFYFIKFDLICSTFYHFIMTCIKTQTLHSI